MGHCLHEASCYSASGLLQRLAAVAERFGYAGWGRSKHAQASGLTRRQPCAHDQEPCFSKNFKRNARRQSTKTGSMGNWLPAHWSHAMAWHRLQYVMHMWPNFTEACHEDSLLGHRRRNLLEQRFYAKGGVSTIFHIKTGRGGIGVVTRESKFHTCLNYSPQARKVCYATVPTNEY